jgi:hypothetical protein
VLQMCKTNPSIAHIGLATHGRSIQIGSKHIDVLSPRMIAIIEDLSSDWRIAVGTR